MSYNNFNGGGYNQGPPGGFNQGPPGNYGGPPSHNGYSGPPGGPGGYNGPPGGGYGQGPPGGYNGPPGGGYGQGHPPGGSYNGPPGGFNGPPGGPGGYNGPPGGGYGQGPPPGYNNNGPPNRQFNGPPGGGYGQGPPPGGSHNGPPNRQFNGPPPMGPRPPGGPGGQGPGGPPNYYAILRRAVNENELGAFYNDQQLHQIAATLPQKIDHIARAWNIPMQIAVDLARLALYDMVIFADDSGSMRAFENGERIEDLKLIITRAAFCGGILDSDGIQVRFMNSNIKGEGLRNEQQVLQMVNKVRFEGTTPLGTELEDKVIKPLVTKPAKHNQLRKPVLVITITDGSPTGENPRKVFKVIEDVKKEFLKSKYRPGACSFQFAQVGNDMKAREFLARLDTDPVVGKMVDCTSNFEIEEQEMAQAGVKLEPATWIVKMMLGSVDPSYDKQDER